ncbi:hypothetical protein [Amycolatopsis sp. NPDC051061]
MSTSTPSADHPQGFAMNLTNGILRCRYVDGRPRVTPADTGA